MDTARWRRASELFGEVIELAPSERESRLREVCADDPALLRAVLQLLAAHGDDNTGLDRLGRVVDQALIAATREEGEPPGRRVGPFTIVREIGAGGMGRVYLAEREVDGAAQRVALKIPPLALLDSEFRHRLRGERRALAGLEHNHIARLVDAGELEDGRPYFAMEYVDGVPLTTYCDQNSLSLPARLRLLIDVCAAVDYAHRQLLVHRDIKPENVLVTPEGVVKLLDFGIAKPIDDARGVATDRTQEERRFFSPATAAPEQVLGRDTGVATDVYALGVLMFNVLAGVPPYALEGLPYADVIARIVDQPAPRMSELAARLTGDAQARARGITSSSTLARALRGDLDAIVAKCLRKDPAHRYAGAQRLADDLEAVLEHRPIGLRHRDRGYRLALFLRRNALAVSLTTLTVTMAIALAVISALQARRLEQERDLAREQQRQAEFQRGRAESTAQFLAETFKERDPRNAQGVDLTASELLRRGEQRIVAGKPEDPIVRAALMSTISDIHFAMNRFKDAERLAKQAAELRQDLSEASPELAQSRLQLARIAGMLERYQESLEGAERVAAQLRAHAIENPTLEQVLALRAHALQKLGRIEEARDQWREVIDLRTAAYGEADSRTLDAMIGLSAVLAIAGLGDESRAIEARVLALRLSIIKGENDPQRLKVMREQVNLELKHHQFERARAIADQALALAIRVYSEQHVETLRAHEMVASVHCDQGQLQSCMDIFRRTLDMRKALFGEKSATVASAEYNLGLIQFYAVGDASAALPHLREAVRLSVDDPNKPEMNLGPFELELGAALSDLGDLAEARAMIDRARARFEAQQPRPERRLQRVRAELACVDWRKHRDDARRATFEQALAQVDKTRFPNESERLARCGEALAVKP